MKLKVLKTATVLTFLLIHFSTEHIGGFFGLFIFFGLFSGDINAFKALIILLPLITFTISAFKPFKFPLDYYLFLIGGLILSIPIVMHTYYVISKMPNRGDTIFFITTLIFLATYLFTLFYIKKSRR